MKTVLVTGSTGFIGTYLVSALQKKSYTVVGLGRNSKNVSYHFIQGDMREYNDVEKAVKGVQAVIHLAASVSSYDEKANYDVNVQGARNVVQACKKHNVSRLIFASSFTTMLPDKDNYGITKTQAEEVFRQSGLDVTFLRFAMVYGKGGKGFTKMVKNVQSVPGIVPLIGKGDYRRQPVYVDDVIRVMVDVLERNETVGKTYYLAGPEAISYKEMLRVIMKELKVKKIMVPIPAFVWRSAGMVFENVLKNPPMTKRDVTSMMADAVFDTSLARKELGFEPVRFVEGVRRSLG